MAIVNLAGLSNLFETHPFEKAVLAREKDAHCSYPYRAYLLRCWREAGDDSTWRFMLEQVLEDRRRWGFNRFDDLVEHLRKALSLDEADVMVRDVSNDEKMTDV